MATIPRAGGGDPSRGSAPEALLFYSPRRRGVIPLPDDEELFKKVLIKRFGCRKTVSASVELVEVDSLKDNEEFHDLLGYINTAKDKQKKGAVGYAK